MTLRLRRRALGTAIREGGGGRGWLCALGAEHVETTMAQEDGAGRGRGWRRKRAADDDGGGGLVLRGPFAVRVDAERGIIVAAVACHLLP